LNESRLPAEAEFPSQFLSRQKPLSTRVPKLEVRRGSPGLPSTGCRRDVTTCGRASTISEPGAAPLLTGAGVMALGDEHGSRNTTAIFI